MLVTKSIKSLSPLLQSVDQPIKFLLFIYFFLLFKYLQNKTSVRACTSNLLHGK